MHQKHFSDLRDAEWLLLAKVNPRGRPRNRRSSRWDSRFAWTRDRCSRDQSCKRYRVRKREREREREEGKGRRGRERRTRDWREDTTRGKLTVRSEDERAAGRRANRTRRREGGRARVSPDKRNFWYARFPLASLLLNSRREGRHCSRGEPLQFPSAIRRFPRCVEEDEEGGGRNIARRVHSRELFNSGIE